MKIQELNTKNTNIEKGLQNQQTIEIRALECVTALEGIENVHLIKCVINAAKDVARTNGEFPYLGVLRQTLMLLNEK